MTIYILTIYFPNSPRRFGAAVQIWATKRDRLWFKTETFAYFCTHFLQKTYFLKTISPLKKKQRFVLLVAKLYKICRKILTFVGKSFILHIGGLRGYSLGAAASGRTETFAARESFAQYPQLVKEDDAQ